MSGLDLERATVAMINIGMAERAFELALDYCKTRRQFGKAIGEFQLVQGKLADMYVDVETAKTFAYRALAACNDADEASAGRGELQLAIEPRVEQGSAVDLDAGLQPTVGRGARLRLELGLPCCGRHRP
jgi:alkylation response protein AidB-like acyl-CoA dehydrogenase